MGELSEVKGRYYCAECGTVWNVVKGKLSQITEDGKEVDIATVAVCEPSEDKPNTYDAYFVSNDKCRFMGVVETEHMQGALLMRTKQGKEIILNWNNVNFVQEM
jgi:hypothetical protein